jgi:WD40 repeat protein
VKFSPDGQQIYVGAENKKPFVISTATGEVIREFEQGLLSVTALDLTKDGHYLAVAGERKRIQLIETTTGNIFRDYAIPDEIVNKLNVIVINSVTLSQDFKYITIAVRGTEINDAGKNSGYVVTWNNTENQLKDYFVDEFAQTAKFSPTGNLLAICHSSSSSNNITLYNTDTWQQQTSLCCHSYLIQDISFSPDGSLLASCGWDGYIKIWDVQQKKLVKEILFSQPNDYIISLSFSLDNKFLFVGGGNLERWSIKSYSLSDFTEKYNYFFNYLFSLSEGPICIDTRIINSQNKIIAGSHRGIVLLNTDWINDVKKISEKGQTTQPNPFDYQTDINVNLTKSGIYKIDIYNSNSLLIENIFNGYLEIGNQTFRWYPKNLPNGTYFCKITGKDYSVTLKILLQR